MHAWPSRRFLGLLVWIALGCILPLGATCAVRVPRESVASQVPAEGASPAADLRPSQDLDHASISIEASDVIFGDGDEGDGRHPVDVDRDLILGHGSCDCIFAEDPIEALGPDWRSILAEDPYAPCRASTP